MLAHHPLTGQPIRILRTETTISSDQKTLVWIRKDFQQSHRWERWYTVITEPEAFNICNKYVAIILQTDSNLQLWHPILTKILNQDSECLLILPNSVNTSLLNTYSFQYNRTLIWEELYDSYPYLGEPLKASDSIEKVIISIAHILRINRIVWSSSSKREDMSFSTQMQNDAWIKTCNGTIMAIPIDANDSYIPKTWLIQQYFRHASNRRNREINTCLEKNVASPWIDNIVLLNERDVDLPLSSNKIQVVPLNHRLTYYDVFKYAQQSIPMGDFVIFSNADIYFNETLEHLWKISLLERKMFLALLRWEFSNDSEPQIFGPRSDSQDSWIFARDSLTFEIDENEFGFPFGKSGCDNVIALLMLRNKFLVINPAYSIHTMHVHGSNIRTYDPKDVLYRSHYLYVDPTPIQSYLLQKNLKNCEVKVPQIVEEWSKRVLKKSFKRPILGIVDNDIQTLCSMLKRSDENFNFLPNCANLWTSPPSSLPLYNFHNCFVSCEGLIYSFQEIYIGSHTGWIKKWENTQQSSIMASIHVPHMIAIPCDPQSLNSLSQWVLMYLPRAYAIRKMVIDAGFPAPEILVPQISDIGSFLQDSIWPEKGNITIVPMIDTMNYYVNNIWAVPPSEEIGTNFVTKEDIDILRSFLPIQTNKNDSLVAVFCVEDDINAVLSRGWAEEVVEHILPKGWIVRYISETDLPSTRRKAFMEASWIFGKGNALDWIWYANPGKTVMEFMYDSDPIGEHIHLAGAADLRYIAGIIKNEPLPYQRQTALMDVGKALKKYGFQETLQSIRKNPNIEIPKIIIPSGKALTGIWNHCGDTFREMVSLWAERKYVVIEHSEETPFCWWGGIGEILLYDRPTSRWWINIPSYQMALFGNCAPPGPEKHHLRQSIWGFWPRSPKEVELMANEQKNMLNYNNRTIQSLFLGKIENGVQRANRLKYDWSKSVELFSMPIDTTEQPYPYTQKEYLQKLCNAKYGLCLPGFGPKCNREIEYFACGCVPIVVEGVDMKNYLIPPREGIHYLRAKDPEDVHKLIKETTPEKWAEMSNAGKDWWRMVSSAEGLFRLTWARIEQCRPYLQVGIPQSFF